ncbi:hypothetical protein ACF1DY_26135 [Streptomyces albus]
MADNFEYVSLDDYTDQMNAETEYDDPIVDPLQRSTMAGMSEAASESVRSEMARREAAGLPSVPEMHWED